MDLNYENSEPDQLFPRLYAYDNGKKSNESDLSGDENAKHSKKDLLIGKKKDKDSKKDRGYAALEGESSPEEQENKSPMKSKKTKSFKFASKNKEKREKSREKDGKEKEKDFSEKKKEKDKKADKIKDKPKSDKKEKRKNEGPDIGDELPVFGVTLELALDRNRCHDGVILPLSVRECIDYVEEYGMNYEHVYKTSSVKSKVQQVKHLYNNRQTVNWADFDVTTATGVLKSFLRELPNPVLTNELLPKFEEASAIQQVSLRETELRALVNQLSECHRTLLAWLILHLDNITHHEKYTKMNAQCIAVTLSSVLVMSQRLITALLFHGREIFPDTVITKYKPPLMASAVNLLDQAEAIAMELKKQESLLSQIHHEMNAGFICKEREELLWEVQRIITQLKRKLRSVQKCQDLPQTQESMDETSTADYKIDACEVDSVSQASRKTSFSKTESMDATVSESSEPKCTLEGTPKKVNPILHSSTADDTTCTSDTLQTQPRPLLSDEDKNILLLQFQNSELIELQTYLLCQIQVEKSEIGQLKTQLNAFEQGARRNSNFGVDNDSVEWTKVFELLLKENQILNIKKNNLVRELMEQREECVNLQSQLLYIALSHG